MEKNATAATTIPDSWTTRRGPAAGASGLSGRIRLGVGNSTIGCLKIDDGTAEILSGGPSEASLTADSAQTLVGLLGGDQHPVVARLQGRISTTGDTALVIKVFLGLQAGSPWSGLVGKGRS